MHECIDASKDARSALRSLTYLGNDCLCVVLILLFHVLNELTNAFCTITGACQEPKLRKLEGMQPPLILTHAHKVCNCAKPCVACIGVQHACMCAQCACVRACSFVCGMRMHLQGRVYLYMLCQACLIRQALSCTQAHTFTCIQFSAYL